MRNRLFCRSTIAVPALICAVALIFCALPRKAHAADEVEVPGATYADLPAAVSAGESSIRVVGAVNGCNIPSGVTMNIDGTGSVAGGFNNRGTVNGAGRCSGTIQNFGGTVTGGGNVVNYTEVASGASMLYDANLAPITVTVYDGRSWIVTGATPYYSVAQDGYLRYYQSGDKIVCSITYLYSNAGRTAMSLANKAAYPTSYAVSFTHDTVIPAAPDQEIDYVFAGWACDALGYTEDVNPQNELTIPAGTFGNITLLSCWTFRNGHNENLSDGSDAMSVGDGASGKTLGKTSGSSGTAGGGSSGALSGLSAAGTVETGDKAESSDTVINLLTGAQSNSVRVRNASSTTRHSFTAVDSSDIEARTKARSRKSFPWQWIGIGLGGGLILVAASITIRRRLRERNAATLEKLRIYD